MQDTKEGKYPRFLRWDDKDLDLNDEVGQARIAKAFVDKGYDPAIDQMAQQKDVAWFQSNKKTTVLVRRYISGEAVLPPQAANDPQLAVIVRRLPEGGRSRSVMSVPPDFNFDAPWTEEPL